ncbi:unnamed protein product [Orchesella dallaii]|uniref:Prolyl endopeptidase n=1 Tax=Orchesella dallaii TaxID=48710 RepID=A0ABP1Q2V8_9HEXA
MIYCAMSFEFIPHEMFSKIADPYRWLEDGERKDTKEFIDSQNKLLHKYIRSNPDRWKIKNKLTEMHFYPKSKIFKTDYLGENLDTSKLSPVKGASIRLREMAYNRNATVLAYSWSKNGWIWATINFWDRNLSRILPDTLENVKSSSILWNGMDGIFYGKYPQKVGSIEPLKNQKLMYHRLGSNQSEDILIFEYPADPHATVAEDLTFVNGGKTLVISVFSDDKIFGQNSLFTADIPETIRGKLEFKPLIPILDAESIIITDIDKSILINTNRNAPNRRVVKIDLENRDESNWETVVEEHPTMPIDWVTVAKGDKLIYSLLDNATSWIRIKNLTNGQTLVDRVPLERGSVPTYTFLGRDAFLLKFETFTNPFTVYKLNFSEDISKLQVYEKAKVKDFDPENFVTKEVYFPSYDGTIIHMFIIHKKTLVLDGTSFAKLWGYGGYNYKMLPQFNPYRAFLLQNFNVVIAIPNLRGGGEYGKNWHLGGMFKNKQKVFEDFQAAAEYLIQNKYTSKGKLWIEGKSNGGLLIGACVNQRPDLFAAAVAQFGVMDLLRFHHFTSGPDWTLELGSPEDPEMFEYIRKYSPLHNIRMSEQDPMNTTQYPAVLVLTATHDDIVVPAHSLKFVAEMQYTIGANDRQTNPILLRIDHQAGHDSKKLAVLMGVFDTKSIRTDELFYTLVLFTVYFLFVGLNYTNYKYRDATCEYVNDLLLLRLHYGGRDVRQQEVVTFSHVLYLFKEEILRVARRQDADLLGITIFFVILGIFIAPFLLFPASIIGQFDYISIALRYLIPVNYQDNFTIAVVHRLAGSLLCQVTVIEMCRSFRILIPNIICIGSLAANNLLGIRRKVMVNETEGIVEYWILQREGGKVEAGCGAIVYVLYQGGSFLIVCIFATTIIGWKFLSMEAYIVAPILFPVVAASLLIGVRLAVSTVNVSEEILRTWRSSERLMARDKNRRWSKRIVRTLRPLGFPVKGLGLFNAELKRTLMERILFSTQDVVVTVIAIL